MISPKGLAVKNQFIIESGDEIIFQSYKSVIAVKRLGGSIPRPDEFSLTAIVLDETYWNYSKTTSKYLALFLGLPIKEVRKRVADNTYILTNLN